MLSKATKFNYSRPIDDHRLLCNVATGRLFSNHPTSSIHLSTVHHDLLINRTNCSTSHNPITPFPYSSCPIDRSIEHKTQIRRLCTSQTLYGKKFKNTTKDPFIEIGLTKTKNTEKAVFAWGLSSTGAIGNTKFFSSQKHERIPKPYAIRYFFKMKVSNVAAGYGFTVVAAEAKDTEHKLFGFGLNNNCQIGFHRDAKTHQVLTQLILPCPIALPLSKQEKIKDIACGRAHTIILTSENKYKGDLFGWGNSEYAQFRAVTEEMQVNVPRHLKYQSLLNKKVIDVSCGGTTCAVLDEEGCVHVWGYGILGKGPKIDHLKEPSMLPKPLFGYNEVNDNVRVVKMDAGLGHFSAITNNGDLFMWGRNREGCLGLNSKENQFFPLRVPLAAVVKKVSLGIDHTVAMTTSIL